MAAKSQSTISQTNPEIHTPSKNVSKFMTTTNTQLAEPIRGQEGATIVGPRNPEIEKQNAISLLPPPTDHGSLPNLKFSFSAAHNRIEDGGWAREVTRRELPVATAMAGVNMRLGPGVIRELHWHKESEWAYILEGSARVTGFDQDGKMFVDDVKVGDGWLFPAGHPHSIQGLEEGTEFLLVFSDGDFSEYQTLLITASEKYIFRAPVPAPLQEVLKQLPYPRVSTPYTYHSSALKFTEFNGGKTLVIDDRNFPVTDLAALIIDLDPGALREMHWHPNADEWLFVVEGQVCVTVFDATNTARTFDYQGGDIGYIPATLGHYILNIGDKPSRVLNVFNNPRFQDISLNQWMAVTPPELVKAHLNVGDEFIKALNPGIRKVVK
jgi:oxalate decarboxylase